MLSSNLIRDAVIRAKHVAMHDVAPQHRVSFRARKLVSAEKGRWGDGDTDPALVARVLKDMQAAALVNLLTVWDLHTQFPDAGIGFEFYPGASGVHLPGPVDPGFPVSFDVVLLGRRGPSCDILGGGVDPQGLILEPTADHGPDRWAADWRPPVDPSPLFSIDPRQIDVTPFLAKRQDIVVAVKQSYPHLHGGEIVDQVAHWLNRAHDLSGAQIVFGRKARQADGGNPNDDVLAIRRSYTDVAQKAMVDVLINAWPGDPDDPTKPVDVPTWDVIPEEEEAGNGFWRPPVTRDLAAEEDPGDPGDPPPPIPPPGDPDDLDAALRDLLDRLYSIDARFAALERLLVSREPTLEGIDVHLTALRHQRYTGRVPFLGTVTLTPVPPEE